MAIVIAVGFHILPAAFGLEAMCERLGVNNNSQRRSLRVGRVQLNGAGTEEGCREIHFCSARH